MASRHDPEDLRLRIFAISAALYAGLGLVWGGLYLILGLELAAVVPLSYAVIVAVTLPWTRRAFAASRLVILACWLVLPFLLQSVLGGFVPGSAAVLWGLAAPIGALMFSSRREATLWFSAFCFLIALAWWLDPRLTPAETPSGTAVTAFFALNLAGISVAVYLLLRLFLRRLEHARAALRREQERSDALLRNMLPDAIADRLKAGERVIADRLAEISVVFVDVAGFTALSERLAPEDVVVLLDRLFTAFDDLTEAMGLEKIRTIGDAYMVVAGAPDRRDDHVAAAADLALAMLRSTGELVAGGGEPIDLRVGLDTGPVVAGVIGRKKYAYDVWGDVVNTASRMESHGVPGRIQATSRAAERLRATHRLEPRGLIEVKGKGSMRTYFVLDRIE